MFLQTRDGVYLDYYARDQQDLLVLPNLFWEEHRRSDAARTSRSGHGVRSATRRHSAKLKCWNTRCIGGEERHFEARLVSAEGDKVLSIVRDVTEVAAGRRCFASQRGEAAHKQSRSSRAGSALDNGPGIRTPAHRPAAA